MDEANKSKNIEANWRKNIEKGATGMNGNMY
jgi:hypothetical protein